MAQFFPACAFALELLSARDAAEDSVLIVAPQSAGRRSAFPELLRCESDWHECNCIVESIRDEQRKGRGLNDMAVIYRSKAQAQRVERALSEASIAYTSGISAKGLGALYGGEDAVKIVSMHSSKGLEFGLVLILGLGEMPKKGEDETDEARLLYVAMTRAIDRLVMTYREHSSFSRRIQDSIGSVRQQLAEMDSQKAAV